MEEPPLVPKNRRLWWTHIITHRRNIWWTCRTSLRATVSGMWFFYGFREPPLAPLFLKVPLFYGLVYKIDANGHQQVLIKEWERTSERAWHLAWAWMSWSCGPGGICGLWLRLWLRWFVCDVYVQLCSLLCNPILPLFSLPDWTVASGMS